FVGRLHVNVILDAAGQAKPRRTGAVGVANAGESLHVGAARRGADGPLVAGDAAAGVAEPRPVGGQRRRRSLEVDVGARTVVDGSRRRRRGVHRDAVGRGSAADVASVIGRLDADVILDAAGQAQTRRTGAVGVANA